MMDIDEDKLFEAVGKGVVVIILVPVMYVITAITAAMYNRTPVDIAINNLPFIGNRLVSDKSIEEKYGKYDCFLGLFCSKKPGGQ